MDNQVPTLSHHLVGGVTVEKGLLELDWEGTGLNPLPMPRKPRLEFSGAIYHVMSRGDRRGDIFLDDADQ
jgi:hypothetical protein